MINSKPILYKKNQLQKLQILIDSRSFDTLLSKNDKKAKIILEYATPLYGNADVFEFIRSPFYSNQHLLNQIIAFKKVYSNDNKYLKCIRVNHVNGSCRSCAIDCPREMTEKIGKILYNKEILNKNELGSIELTFIQHALNETEGESNASILVTGNETLLKSREWIEGHIPGKPTTIISTDEALEIMDLFAKSHGKYYITGNFTCNKGYYYLLLFSSEVPHFTYKEGLNQLRAFENRFIYLLETIDNIGFQYYRKQNNDTIMEATYYLNYFVILTTGIFDALALTTKKIYNLTFKGDQIPSRTSLNKNVGRDFLEALKNHNSELYEHIYKYMYFIKLMYGLRELVVHREMPPECPLRFYDGSNAFINVSKDVTDLIRRNGDGNNKYNSVVTNWGIWRTKPAKISIRSISEDDFIEPFNFTKAASRMLLSFSDGYLRLLGFPNIIEADRKNTELLKNIRDFREHSLSFMNSKAR